MTIKGIQLKDAELVINNTNIKTVVAEQQEDGEWAFLITFLNSETHEEETVYIEKQRLGMRTWADPRKMFDFMYEKFGISEGQFKISEKRFKDGS